MVLKMNIICSRVNLLLIKAGIGGPLIDFDGNFIGMNFHGMEETHYLPRPMVLELLRHFERYAFTPFFLLVSKCYSST